MTKGIVLGPSTLVPLSSMALLFSMAFWIGGLAHEVEKNSVDVKTLSQERGSFQAEILQQMANQSATIGELQAQAAAMEAKIDLLIEWERASRLPQKHRY